MFTDIILQESSRFFNVLPLFNFRWQRVLHKSFTEDYFQGLFLWSCLLIVASLIMILILIVAWSTKCCARRISAGKKSVNYRSTCNFLLPQIVFSCLLLFVALWANEMINRRVIQATGLISSATHQTSYVFSSKLSSLNKTVLDVKPILHEIISSVSALGTSRIKYLGVESWTFRIDQIENETAGICAYIESFYQMNDDLKIIHKLSDNVGNYESERRTLFGSLLTIILVIMIWAITVAFSQSIRGLILFGGVGIVAFLISSCIVSITFSYNILMVDLCSHPDSFLFPFIQSNIGRAYFDNWRVTALNSTSSFDVAALNFTQQLVSIQNSVERIPSVVNGLSCSLGNHAGETSSTIIQILSLCHSLQRKFYDLIIDVGTLISRFDEQTYLHDFKAITTDVCYHSRLAVVVLLISVVLFSFLLFIILISLNCYWYVPKFNRLHAISTQSRANATHSLNSGGCPADSYLLSDSHENLNSDQTRINNNVTMVDDQNDIRTSFAVPADFYGTHMSNPRAISSHRRHYDSTPAGHATTSDPLEHPVSSGLWRTTPPPAYECVPLLRSHVRHQRL